MCNHVSCDLLFLVSSEIIMEWVFVIFKNVCQIAVVLFFQQVVNRNSCFANFAVVASFKEVVDLLQTIGICSIY